MVKTMANLWQFFGLPDPEVQVQSRQRIRGQSTTQGRGGGPQNNSERREQQTLETIQKAIALSKQGASTKRKDEFAGWKGGRTPEGEPFHDLAGEEWQQRTKRLASLPSKALRYIIPDTMHRLPYDGMARRIEEGDTLVVDIRSLIHMDAQQSACRRMLREMANEYGVVVFALDAEEKLLLIPGRGNVVDTTAHELGISGKSPLL